MTDRQAHPPVTNGNGNPSLARSKSLSGKQPQQPVATTPTTNAPPSVRRSASQRGPPPSARRPSFAAGLTPGGLTPTSDLYNAVPAPPPHLRSDSVLAPSPLATQDSAVEDSENENAPRIHRPQPMAATPGQSFYGGGGFTTLPEGSPVSSPYNSAPASRRGSFVSHPHASGPRPPVIRRRDSSASGYGYPDPVLANGQVYVDVDPVATPSMLSRAGSPTLPLMTQKTASRSSSRRGSVADGAVRPGFGFGGGFGGFEMSMMNRPSKDDEFVGSIDCGTTSTRFIIFDKYAKIICEHQTEYPQHYPHPNWHEHEPQDLVDSVTECIARAIEKLEFLGYNASSVKCIGITNQRETTLCWDKQTGKALCRAIVWDDARTVSMVREFQKKLDEEGLPAGEGEQEVTDYAQTARGVSPQSSNPTFTLITNTFLSSRTKSKQKPSTQPPRSSPTSTSNSTATPLPCPTLLVPKPANPAASQHPKKPLRHPPSHQTPASSPTPNGGKRAKTRWST